MDEIDKLIEIIPKDIVQELDKTKLKKDLQSFNSILKEEISKEYVYGTAIFTWFFYEDHVKGLQWILENKDIPLNLKEDDTDYICASRDSYTQCLFDIHPSYEIVKLFIKHGIYNHCTSWLYSSYNWDDQRLFDLLLVEEEKELKKYYSYMNPKNSEKFKKEVYIQYESDLDFEYNPELKVRMTKFINTIEL